MDTSSTQADMKSGNDYRHIDRFWPQLRRFLVFQLKLYIDAFRDFFLSLLSLGAFLLDVVTQSHGPESHFERVLKLGRRSEKAINLFDQYDLAEQGQHSVDGVISDVETRLRNRKRP